MYIKWLKSRKYPLILVFIFIITPIILVCEASAQNEGRVYNRKGRLIGTFNATGDVFNASSSLIGKVTADGYVLNRYEKVIGKVNSLGSIFNKSGKMIGQVDPKGQVTNNTGLNLGRVHDALSVCIKKAGAALLLLL